MRFMNLSDMAMSMTGYSSQSRLLCSSMKKAGHDVFHIGHNYIGQHLKKAVFVDDEVVEYDILPGNPQGPYAQGILPEYMEKYKPEIFHVLLDTFMLHPWIWQDPRYQFGCPSTFWFPSDGGWFPEGCEMVLQKFSHPVAMSKFGQAQVKKQFGLKTGYIPHGIRTTQYFPLLPEHKKQLRQQYGRGGLFAFDNGGFRPLLFDFTNKFVVGCVSRNQPRKMMDRLIKAFCLFAKNKDDVLLLIHSDARDVAAGFSLQNLANRFGQGHKIVWTGMKFFDAWPSSQMNHVYNLMDVHFLLTSGEGFGIPTIEAMACEVPVVQTGYTTTKELVLDHDAGLAVNLVGGEDATGDSEQLLNGTLVGTFMVDRAMGCIRNAAEQLEKLYIDKNLREKLGKNGRRAVLNEYSWDDVVFPMWQKQFERMVG